MRFCGLVCEGPDGGREDESGNAGEGLPFALSSSRLELLRLPQHVAGSRLKGD